MELLLFSSDPLLAISALTITITLFLFLRFGPPFLINRTKSSSPPLPPEPSGGLPIVGHLLQFISSKQTLAQAFADIADRHVSDPKTVQECFTANDRALASRPWSSQAEFLNYRCAGFAAAPYGTYWRDIRKLAVTQLLSSHRLKSLAHIQVSEINMLVRELHRMCRRGGGVVGISEVIEQMGSNMITRLIAGKRCFNYRAAGAGDGGGGGDVGGLVEGERIGRLMRDFMRVCGEFVPSDIVPLLGWMNWMPGGGVLKSMQRIGKELDVVMQSWIEEHKQRRRRDDEEEQGDFIDVMLSAIGDDFAEEYSPETIVKATALTLILAGADTTSITVIWTLSNLLNNRNMLELAQQELDVKVGKTRPMEHSDISSLIYLQAIVKETLRLYPPAPTAIPHQATEDCTIHGYRVPKGTRVFANLWKLHRDPNVWSDPDEFRPERFLVDQLQGHDSNLIDGLSTKNFELVPFGSGRRSCPGEAFALQIVHLAIGRLLQGFDITNHVGDNQPVDMAEGQGLTMPRATPLEVKMVPRLSLHLYEVC
ncbi:unnamed protein product [Linum tenue]|uniref:Cytochrome P450 n=1 Tax=Linum tenue TaxID=586396 RepID=A0AAV0KX34_9ROSI|nr:unnamed protein product [Linum tenue]